MIDTHLHPMADDPIRYPRSSVLGFPTEWSIGRSLTATVEGEAGPLFATFESLGALAAPITIPGITGQLWLDNPVALDANVMPAAGRSSVLQQIPNDPALVNTYLAFQSLVISPSWQWRLSNLADCFVTSGQ